MNRGKIELRTLRDRPSARKRARTGGEDGRRGLLATADIFLFEDFRLDRRGEGLSRRDKRGIFVPVSVGPRTLDVLAVLVGRAGQLVLKEEIMAAVWGRTAVENANLTVQISVLRRTLDQGRAEGSCIQTIAARGYRFVAPVTRVKHPTPVPAAGVTPEEAGSASVSPRLAIVVLPFASFSDDPELGHFADGITDDLTTDLSWTPEFFVISRSTAFAYRGNPVDARRMGRELGVNYVVEGSLRTTDNYLQVNAQLIDAESGAHVWADRFETDCSDMSAAGGEITGRLLWDLRRNLFAAASRRAARDNRSDGNAETIAIRGWSVFHRPRSATNIQEALQLWERALNIDPELTGAKIGVALALASNFWYGWSRSFQQDEACAERLLLEVFAVDPSDITARIVIGILRRLQGRLTESKIELESVPALDRNVAGLRQLGATLVYLGEPEAAIRHLERSIRLSPHEANVGFNYTYSGLCHLLLGRVEKAVDHLRMARTSNPRIYIVHLYLAAALALNGDLTEAGVTLAEGIKLKPEVNSLAGWHIYRPWETNPQYLALRAKTLDVGLFRAGFPVGPTPHEAHPPAVSLIAGSRAQVPRMSIVVLPFTNLSDDPEQRYFADGLVDDLTTDLSRIDGMFVISRNTAFTYKDAAVTAKQISQELGVRYALEGSVRRSGGQLRVNVQLIDAGTGAHLWAERFDRDLGDLFALQNEITSRIAVALDIELVGAEAARPTERPDAVDYILRGRAASWKSPTPEKYAEAISFFERALLLSPDSVEANSLLAAALANRALDHMSDMPAADLARAEALVTQALLASPRSIRAHFARAEVLRVQRCHEDAIPEYEKAIAANRNWADALVGLGWCKFWIGEFEEAIAVHDDAIRLSPRDPLIGYWYFRIGLIRFLQSRINEAIPWFEKARGMLPTFPPVYSFLGSAHALRGEAERGAALLAETYRLSGTRWVSTIADMRVTGYWGPPSLRALYESIYFAGLRKLGVPEE